MTVAFLFPGQGAQSVGLLHHLPQHAEVTRTIAEAGAVLGLNLGTLDTAQALHSTVAVQLELLVAGVATARALTMESTAPSAVAGMSVGAFGAAVICGTLAFDDALRLIRRRAELMQAAFPIGYGLAAIVGLDESRVEALAEQVRARECPVYVSNINAPRQIVVAGGDAVCADHRGASARRTACRPASGQRAVALPPPAAGGRSAGARDGPTPTAPPSDALCEQPRRSRPLRCRIDP
jgi:malonate decarboxylase epsilon subunit